jgi:dephospho-CoA kinase
VGEQAQKPVIGIVGGVGAGKTAAAAEFAALGCRVIDADAVGHRLLDRPAVRDALIRRWGEGILAADGAIDRAAVARIVFADAEELPALNALVHPLIRERLEAEVAAARTDAAAPAVVIDAAVLFEAGWDDLCTHTVFVEAPEAVRAERSRGRGWSAEDWSAREKSQIPLDTKAGMCDYTIDNSSSVSHLREQVRTLFHEVTRPVDRI